MLSTNHWTIENFRERITAEEWKEVLLSNREKIFVHGRRRTLVVKDLGYGVVEVYKRSLYDDEKFPDDD